MHDLILRCLTWARTTFWPGAADRTGRATRAPQIPTPQPMTPPAPKAPSLAEVPMGDGAGPVFLWVTAHGIDFRPRQPHGAEVSR
ncbi:hypothetical protein AF335_16095 [Streptomyces eurocidicus]|uniref:Uncharacterized protein n=1 Tax=Streptomyces eurocidicus TaxID=66423 RepID=A0A2N8NW48_STREU|nr:hypothetical protein [Streptomyces eurocidicus]PNE33003.1 hypothetical protein AF335_16095 [Streptomyces eurocidicus]